MDLVMSNSSEQDAISSDLSYIYPLGSVLTYRLSKLQARLNAQAADLLRRHGGVPLAHWRVLLVLSSGLATTQKEIVELAAFDKGQVSRIVDRLIEEDFLVSESDVDDKRIRKLKVTPSGRQMISRLIPLMQQRQAHLVGKFSEDEKQLLFGFLDRLDEVSGKLSL